MGLCLGHTTAAPYISSLHEKKIHPPPVLPIDTFNLPHLLPIRSLGFGQMQFLGYLLEISDVLSFRIGLLVIS